MKLALIMLTALLMISLALIQVVIFPTFQNKLTADSENWQLKYLTSGQIKMLSETLSAQPENSRNETLENLKEEFGFYIRIDPMTVHSFSKQELQQLKSGETIANVDKEATYQRIDDNYYITFDSQESVPPHLVNKAQRYTMGSFFLIQNALNKIPPTQWDEAFLNIEKHYMHPMALVNIDELELSTEELKQLQTNAIVTIQTEDSKTIDYPADWALQKIGKSNRAIKNTNWYKWN